MNALCWILRIAVTVLAWLHLNGNEGAGRVAVVYFSVMTAIGLPLAVFLVLSCFTESGRAAIRAKKEDWPRYPIFRWIWSLGVVAYLAWTEHQWLAGALLLTFMLVLHLRATAHGKEPAGAAGR
ncbi:hypothetical protein UB46_43150 [Burkholderiaceae bacterium 16]|nr:hypothetical protein UB46_43150 [Burkholderiaceae bacterium 16]